jgi:hypothetical protein
MLLDPKWLKTIEMPEVPTETWRQDLLEAANLLATHGMCKRYREDSLGSMCVHGAVAKAATGHVAFDSDRTIEAMTHLSHYLVRQGQIPDPEFYVPRKRYWCAHWNNQPERTTEEVIAALSGAAREVA